MAVAAADFYTYARATGTPLPQNKKEEAELVPAINQWKRNQLRQQKQDDNNINGGAIAAVAGLAGLGAAALAASRGGLRTKVTNAVDPTSGSRISTGIGGLQQDLNEKVTQSRNWDDYRDSIALKTKVTEPENTYNAFDYVTKEKETPVDFEQAYVRQKLQELQTGPKAIQSLGEEQLDIIRGTSPTGGSARENAERSAELNRQAQMRRRLPEEGGQEVLKDLFAKPQVEDPFNTSVVTNNNVDSPVTTNDFLQKEGPGKYIDPELVTNSSAGNVPKSTTTQDQAISAINSAEDQDTGRIRDAIVKDPNIDTSNLDDVNLQNISQNLPVTQEEQRVGIATRPTAQELLNQTKGEIIKVEGPQGQVRYAETRPDPSWVGAKSDIPTNTPAPGPDLSQTELSRVLQRQRYEIASNLRKKGEPITPGKIESELQKFYGPKSYDYVRNELRKTNVRDYTKRKHALQLGATYDPKFFDDVDLDSVQIAGENIPVIPSRRFTEAETPYTGKAYLDDYSDSLKTPFYSEDTALGLAEQVDKKKNWLKDVREDITNTMENLELQAKTIQEKQNLARSQGDRRTVNLLDIELNKLRATYQKQQRRIAGSEKSIKESIADLSVPLTVGELPENAGKRIYYETDTTGGKGQKIGKQLPDVDLADEVVDDIDRIRTPIIDPESVELRSE
jgi:hypothetical protein